MTSAVLTGSLRLAIESWRGQLVVLIAGVVTLGVLLDTAGLGDRPMTAALVASSGFIVLLAAAARAAHTREEVISLDVLLEELIALARILPRLVTQVLAIVAVPTFVTIVGMQAASVHPLLGLLLVPAAFAAAMLAMPLAMLATVAVVVGDQRWLPQVAWATFRSKPLPLIVTTLVGWLLAALVAVPLVLTGMVVAAIAGPFGLIGTGVATIASTPWLGCIAVSMWRRSGASIEAPGAADGEVGVPVQALAEQFGVPAAAAVAWMDGPVWDVAVEPGSVWGTWIRMEAPATVAFRLTWSGQVPPQLALGAEDGTWTMPEQVAASGASTTVQLPAGNTYVQVGSHDVAAQAIGIAMLVAVPAAA